MKSFAQNDQGFTLIEILVVILIIGILAAIALPNFLSQRSRAFDSNAKSNVRNLMTQVEACNTSTDTYVKCDTVAELPSGMGIGISSAPGDVEINATTDGYDLIAHSKTGSTFTITKTSGTWAVSRTCVVAPGLGNAGCPGGSW